jgi:hypothetical protein
MLVTVTASQDDADSSEFLDRLVAGTIPAGWTLTPAEKNPATEEDTISQVFTLTVPARTDIDFDLGFTAYSREASNGDEEESTLLVPIEIDFTHNETLRTFQTEDQSVWQTGDNEPFHEEPFLGLENQPLNFDQEIPTGQFVGPFPIILDVESSGHLTVGFDTVVEFDLGEIDVDLNLQANLDTTYNKTTNTLWIEPSALAKGGTFTTTGPSGFVSIGFTFDMLLDLSVGLFPLSDIFDFTNFSEHFEPPPQHLDIFTLSTDDIEPFTWSILPGIVSLTLVWPDLGIESDDLSATDSSQNIVELGLDVEGAAITAFPLLAPIDPNIFNEDNLEWVDIDLTGGLNLIQDLAVNAMGFKDTKLVLEDGTELGLQFDSLLMIPDASSHDANGDGQIAISLVLNPAAQLENTTAVGINVGAEIEVLKNLPIVGGDLYDSGPLTLPVADIPVFDDAFELAGFDQQSWNLFV